MFVTGEKHMLLLKVSMSKGSVRSRRYQVNVIAERCKGCGFCVEFCPRHILSQSAETNSQGYHQAYINDNDKCTGCNICSMACPDFAIYVVSVEEKPKEEVE